MVLEATMIIIDNSESSRNGDYLPNRFSAQGEATTLIFNAKTQSNPESAVGLMSMAGPSPTVLVTPTTDLGAILAGLHKTKIKGSAHLSTALSIAALALRHRQNMSQRQRIVCFSCSSISEDTKQLVALAKKLKKSNVHVDFVAFGDLDSEKKDKLTQFNDAIAGGDGSYLAIIPPGPNLLSDGLLTTPIIGAGMGSAQNGDGLDGETAVGTGGGGFEFGVDPNTDPDLAMALRMSMEEEQNRLERDRQERERQENANRMDAIPEEGAAGHAVSDAGDQAANRQPKVEDEKDGDDQGGNQDHMDTA